MNEKPLFKKVLLKCTECFQPTSSPDNSEGLEIQSGCPVNYILIYCTRYTQGRIFIISLGGGGGGGGGVDKSWGGVISSLITGSLSGASRRLTRMNFSLA